MTTPAAQPLTTVVRKILAADTNLTLIDLGRRLKARGVVAPDAAIKKAYYNVRGELRKTAPMPAPAAARTSPAPAAPAGVDLTSVLSNIALVNKVVGACGGVDPARQVAEAVRSCGSVDEFLQHLDTVAGIRTVTPPV